MPGRKVHTLMAQQSIVTLDHNSIIALEHPDEPQQQPIAGAIRELIRYHHAGYIALKVTSSTMLENPRCREEDLDVAELIEHYQKLGLGSVELFRGPHVLSFTDGKGHLFASPSLEQWFLRSVHTLLHPTIDFDLRAYCQRYCKEHGLDGQDATQVATIIDSRWLPLDAFAARAEAEHLQATRPDLVRHAERIRKKWNNAKSDALGLCTHASWGGAIFVTNDGDFHGKNHDELERLTNGHIPWHCESSGVSLTAQPILSLSLCTLGYRSNLKASRRVPGAYGCQAPRLWSPPLRFLEWSGLWGKWPCHTTAEECGSNLRTWEERFPTISQPQRASTRRLRSWDISIARRLPRKEWSSGKHTCSRKTAQISR